MSIYSLTKTCSKCGQDKPLSEYNKHKSNKDGLQYHCNDCRLIQRIQDKDKIKERDRIYRQNNREKNIEYLKIYRQSNKLIRNQKDKERKQSDSLYKLTCNIRSLITGKIKQRGYNKNTKTQEILGCDWNILKEHFESQFDNDMSWDNQGTYWDIDHIIPVSSAKTEEDIIRLNHYTNLRPLERNYNRFVKRNKIENY